MNILRILLRGVAALGVAFVPFWFFATITTDGWYFESGWWRRSLRTVTLGSLFAIIFLSPISWLPFLGLPRRRIMLGMIVIPILAVFSAEFIGRAQEFAALRTYGLTPSEPVRIGRWWPVGHHTIAFSSKSGWCGWD